MDDYAPGKPIGDGGFGIVWSATRKKDGAIVAVKRLPKGSSKDDHVRFAREVRMQSKLTHPNIVQILDFGLLEDPPWFAMPIAKTTLESILENDHGEEYVWMVLRIIKAVAYAHENGVLHRDIKPANILVFDTPSGEDVALADFGLGRFVDRDTTRLTGTNAGAGTQGYAAPEQWADLKDVDQRADIHALGRVLYAVMTGDDPGVTYDPSKLPGKFQYIVMKAANPDPVKRYASAGEMLDSLRRLVIKDPFHDLLANPVQELANLAKAALERKDFSAATMDKLAAFVLENVDDEEMLTLTFPKLPDPILVGIAKSDGPRLRAILREFDATLDEYQPFEYCDTVANLYSIAYQNCNDVEVRELVLRRLFDLGPRHNRFHVGDVFAQLVANTKDEGALVMIREVLLSDEDYLEWNASYLRDQTLPRQIRDVVPKE